MFVDKIKSFSEAIWKPYIFKILIKFVENVGSTNKVSKGIINPTLKISNIIPIIDKRKKTLI